MTLENLCVINAVSGNESKICKTIYEDIKNIGLDEIYTDKVGNLVCVSYGSERKQRILVTAHVDEVGFQVVKKLDCRKYRIKSVGSVNAKKAIGAEVTSSVTKGVLKSAVDTEISSYDYDKLCLETDNDRVNVGDIFSFVPHYTDDSGVVSCKALDNRVGCFCLIEQMKRKSSHKSDIFYVFTVQEETSFRGCRVARSVIRPDIYVNIDTSPVDEMNSVEMGKGVAIKISDGYVFVNPNDVDHLAALASSNNIAYQYEVNDFGLNESVITNEYDNGCSIIGLSVPCKDIHTNQTEIVKGDIQQTIDLLDVLLTEL